MKASTSGGHVLKKDMGKNDEDGAIIKV